MAFTATLETNNGVAKIYLSGELDASTAPDFKKEVDKAAGENIKSLVLLMHDLEYMASAGLRVLVYAVQKMRQKGGDTDVYVISPQDMVKETLDKTGVDKSVTVLDKYDPAVIEKV